jgi:signal transduction histidine kinase/CheY-like chemotaxis protein
MSSSAPPSIDARVLAEQVTLVYRNTPGMIVMALCVAPIVGYMLRPVTPAPLLYGWLAALTVSYLLRVLLVVAYWRRAPDRGSIQLWVNLYLVVAFVSGLVWGLVGTLLFPATAGIYQSAIVLVIAGLPAGALFSLSPLFSAFASFALPIVVPTAVYHLWSDVPDASVLGLGLAICSLVMIATGLKLQRFTADSLRLRFEREAAESERECAREAAEAANRAKSRFLANMSHEIRTPMNGVLGFAELMLATSMDEQQRRYMQTLYRSGESLLAILNDVLDFSKIEAGKLELRSADFDPRATLSEVTNLFAARARSKGVDLWLEIEPDVPGSLHGDAGRLRQVLSNLIGNAVKYTLRGAITIRAGRGKLPFAAAAIDVAPHAVGTGRAWIWVAVADTGAGISAEDRARLFQPFEQGAEALPGQRLGGTGLGLAISRQLVELMGGYIGVESTPGHGSTFWFHLPFDVAASQPPATPVVPPSDADGALLRGRVLLVEDNPVNREVASAMLESLGIEWVSAANGVEALGAFAGSRFDAVLMDCLMPEMDGFTAARHIRSSERRGTRVPIIAFTANAVEGDRDRCLAAGMDDYLAKPFKKADLQAKLARWIPVSGGSAPEEPVPAPQGAA